MAKIKFQTLSKDLHTAIDRHSAANPASTRETRTRIEQSKCPDCYRVGLAVFLRSSYVGLPGEVRAVGTCARCARRFSYEQLRRTDRCGISGGRSGL